MDNMNYDTLGSLTEIKEMNQTSSMVKLLLVLAVVYFIYKYYYSTENFKTNNYYKK